MKVLRLPHRCDVKKITVDESDYKSLETRLLANMAFQIFLIRTFEQTLLRLSADACIHGPVHTSIGQEACAAGAMAALRGEDAIVSTHRAHHHYLAKIMSYHSNKGFDALKGDIPPSIAEEVKCLMGEIMGLSIGCCGGRGGSMHLRNARIGVIGTDAIVAGGVPLATGAAFASRYEKKGNVVICFLGDGAVNQGAFHEGVNLAGIWKLPIVYFIENNEYAVGTKIKDATASRDLAVKASAYGLRGRLVDGMDPVAVLSAVREAADYARLGEGATLIEAKCYRYLHHAGPSPGSAYGYRTRKEEISCLIKDPYAVFGQKLVDLDIIAKDDAEVMQEKAVRLVEEAASQCIAVRENKYVVKDELWPKVETLEKGLRSDGEELKNLAFCEVEDFLEFESISYVEAIASVTGRNMEKDTRVFVIGEEVANLGGGAYGATKGLVEKFPGRIFNTPISESGFSGLAGGAAMCGLRPIVEIMFPDFALVAADQLFNQVGKLRHMYGNSTDMPVVVRTRIAIGCGYGGQHSGDPTALFSLFSGWRIVAPSNAFDYIGLFNTAVRCLDPVLVMEHHALYPLKSDVPKGNLDYFIPFGKAKCVSKGDDVTAVCYSSMVPLVTQASKELSAEGIAVEVIDLRTVSPNDIDYETIGASLKKTGVLVIVEQAPKSNSIGARIAYECERRFLDYLDCPTVTITGADIPNPVSKRLEEAALPNVSSVKNTIRRAAQRAYE